MSLSLEALRNGKINLFSLIIEKQLLPIIFKLNNDNLTDLNILIIMYISK